MTAAEAAKSSMATKYQIVLGLSRRQTGFFKYCRLHFAMNKFIYIISDMSVKSTEIAAFRAARKAVSPEILPEKIEKRYTF